MPEQNKELLDKLFDKVGKPTDPGSKIAPRDQIVCIVDRSGSMRSIKNDAEGGLNNFIEEQKKVEGGANLTIVEFDDEINPVCEQVNIEQAPTYKLVPRGMTALLDAIGSTIADKEKFDCEGTTIIVVVTDGGENSSREYNKDSVFKMIEERKEQGWEFMFLAANQDAISTGRAYGFSADDAASFAATADGVAAAYTMSSNYTTNLRSVGKAAAMKSKKSFIEANADLMSDKGAVGSAPGVDPSAIGGAGCDVGQFLVDDVQAAVHGIVDQNGQLISDDDDGGEDGFISNT